jgi:hypothetical protein
MMRIYRKAQIKNLARVSLLARQMVRKCGPTPQLNASDGWERDCSAAIL